MHRTDLLILTQSDVDRILRGQEELVVDLARQAYLYHRQAQTIVPAAAFLRLSDRTRAIALPAYVNGETNVMGVKWISSFPDNRNQGLPRAIGTIVLNSPENGLPFAFMDGTLVSSKRTAAGAALAARCLAPSTTASAGLIGAGPINAEIASFLRVVFAGLRRFCIFDVISERAEALANCLRAAGDDAVAAASIDDVFRNCSLVSFATSSVQPHVTTIPQEFSGGTILHMSLRDLSAEFILSACNIVDDIDHVCQHRTSVHLAEMQAGNRDFIHYTLGDLLSEGAPSLVDHKQTKVFSPFGLGALDIVLADHVYRCAVESGAGTSISGMFAGPDPNATNA